MENEMEKLQNKFLQDAVSRRSDSPTTGFNFTCVRC